MRGAPQVGFSATMRKMSSRRSTLMHFLPRAHPVPRQPGPIQLEAGAVPSHNCIRLNENQCMPPPGPEPSQYHPEKSVGSSKPRTGMSPFQNSKLLTESQILQEEIAARTKESDNWNSQKPQEAQHQGSIARGQPRPIQAHLHDSTEELYFGERQAYYSGLRELLEKEFLFRSPYDGTFF